jgi:hypothetical protein
MLLAPSSADCPVLAGRERRCHDPIRTPASTRQDRDLVSRVVAPRGSRSCRGHATPPRGGPTQRWLVSRKLNALAPRRGESTYDGTASARN